MPFLFENDDSFILVELLDRADFRIENDKFPTTAASQCVFPAPDIDDVIFQRREQKAPELAPRAVSLRINLVLQEVGKKSLHQILGVRRGKTAPPNEAVKRWPVIATELCHGGFSVRGSRGAVRVAGGHDTPARRRKRRSTGLECSGNGSHIYTLRKKAFSLKSFLGAQPRNGAMGYYLYIAVSARGATRQPDVAIGIFDSSDGHFFGATMPRKLS
jgi:hypothetical protein